MKNKNNKKKLLLTGGAGFVGHHVVEGVLKKTDWDIVILDRLDISGNLERLTDIDIWEEQKHRVKFVWWDLKSPLNGFIKSDIGEDVNYIWHLAASSHVDRSIEDPMSFVMDNVVGTCNLLLFAKELKKLERFIYFSTDEVFGPAPEGVDYKEWDRYRTGNPYAATKAGAEELCISFQNTYRMPILITHTMNVFGQRQHPEKFIPMTIKKVIDEDVVTIHANKDKTKSGSRYYIHARNVCDALLFLNEKGEEGDKYNITGEREVSNLDLARIIAKVIGKPLQYEMVDFHSSRPGHDLRYALDGSKMKEMGWELPKDFVESMEDTIEWYLKSGNERWLGK
jgi:dTDP-glucose 4,6-dehydratase